MKNLERILTQENDSNSKMRNFEYKSLLKVFYIINLLLKDPITNKPIKIF